MIARYSAASRRRLERIEMLLRGGKISMSNALERREKVSPAPYKLMNLWHKPRQAAQNEARRLYSHRIYREPKSWLTLTLDGETKSFSGWAADARVSVSYNALYNRKIIKGWPDRKTLLTPPLKKGRPPSGAPKCHEYAREIASMCECGISARIIAERLYLPVESVEKYLRDSNLVKARHERERRLADALLGSLAMQV